jgi:LuxR family transcriptional activator of conjugal transfer of Ti plasmids
MHRVFQRFIDLLSSADDVESFSKAIIISTYPADWLTHYSHRHYERLDPVVAQALLSPEPFQWGSGAMARQLSSAQFELFSEASRFGIRFGFTVPIHDGHGPIAALTFATNEKRPQFESCTNLHARVLQLMAMYLGPPAFAREAREGCRAEAQRAKAGRIRELA